MGDSYPPDSYTHNNYRPSQLNQDGRAQDSTTHRATRVIYDSYAPIGGSYMPGERGQDLQPKYSAYGNQQQGSWSGLRTPDPRRPSFDPHKYGNPNSSSLNPQASVSTPQQSVWTRNRHIYRIDKSYRMTSPSHALDPDRQIHSSAKLNSSQHETPRTKNRRYDFRDSVKPAADRSQVLLLSYRPKQSQPERERQGPKLRSRPPPPDVPSPRSVFPVRSSPLSIVDPRSIPKPTPEYIAQAALPPVKITSPQPLLLVIDLNGTLILRDRASRSFVVRRNAQKFISHILATYTVVVWSSAQPKNVNRIVEKLFTKKERQKLIAVWGRDKLDLSQSDYREKVQVYKRLQKVWDEDFIQRQYPAGQNHTGAPGGVENPTDPRWDQTNTILIDDSRLKAATQPFNLIEIPEFVDKNEQQREGPPVLDDVTRMLEILSYQGDVSRFLRVQRDREGTSNSGATADSINGGLVDGEETVSEETVSEDDIDDEGGLMLMPLDKESAEVRGDGTRGERGRGTGEPRAEQMA